MRKAIILAAIILVGFSALEAQNAMSTLAIKEFSGGSGYDAGNIAAMLAGQPAILDNFILVKDGSQAEYFIEGEIQRVNLAQTVIFTAKRARDNATLGTESLSYRAFIEVGAFMPTIAAHLARMIDHSIVVHDNLLPLPKAEAPAIVRAPPPRVTVPSSRPQPAQAIAHEPDDAPEPTGDREAQMIDFRNNKLFFSGWLGFSVMKVAPAVALEAELRFVPWFGLKVQFGGVGFNDTIAYEYGWWSGGIYYHNYWEEGDGNFGALLLLAPELSFRIGIAELNIFIGPAFSWSKRDSDRNNMYSDLNGRYFGFLTGIEIGWKVGVGSLFVAINGGFLGCTNTDNIKESLYRYGFPNIEYPINRAAASIGIGYRFGLGKIKEQEEIKE